MELNRFFMLKKMTPLKLILYWLLLLFVLAIIVIPILFFATVGGEQKPLTFLVYLTLLAYYGTIILAVVTPFFYFEWFKKNWYVNVIFLLAALYFVFKDQKPTLEIEYGFTEKTDSIGNNEIKTLIEYYSQQPEKIRSISYWKNGKRDSVWTVYQKDGSVVSRLKYKNGALIKDSN